MLQIETLDAFDAHLTAGRPLDGVIVQAVDLTGRTDALLARSLAGVVLLGCHLEPRALAHAMAEGAIVFPSIPHLPFEAHRATVYTPEELYDGFDRHRPESYLDALDARVYRHYIETGATRPDSLLEALARRLHDLSMTDAVDALITALPDPRRVVAMMGGHGMARSRGDYLQVARICAELTRRGFLMISGGGPGAMEATHLGAWFADRPDAELVEAVDVLALAPGYRDEHWLARAFEVRERWPRVGRAVSLGIPTWHYGHEPPNPFATHIAKYFANSVREDGLVTLARCGIVFAPGSAGTIQEIFQDACQNHYRSIDGLVSPMILLGTAWWSETKPVFPLLQQLATGYDYAAHLHLTDREDEVVALVERFAASLPAR